MKLYPYQERVKGLLQERKAVILQAPTGSGKTVAALAPFIESFFTTPAPFFPRKCVYSVPMRVLATQFYEEQEKLAAAYQRKFRRTLDVRIQTGDQQADKWFEGDLIFCTIDQFLANYLMMPYSLPLRLANLNAGALAGAYLVIDEFHLLDPGSSLPSTLYALRQLRRLAPVLLMTATFSASMLQSLAKQLDAEVVLVPEQEVHKIETRSGSVAAKQRIWTAAESFLTAASVLATHQRSSLAICNTVRRAQQLYRELRDTIKEQNLNIRVLLLHSRFLVEDRQAIEKELRQQLGKGSDHQQSLIVVATQTVEVGLDITCEVMHTELAPASALIQRAGRCARFPGERGQVIVYPVESYRPYGSGKDPEKDESLWGQEMRAAWSWLQANSGEIFNFTKEQAFVDAVAAKRDEKVLSDLSAGRSIRAEKIQKVLIGDRDGSERRLLIRDADSRLVLVNSQPDDLVTDPFGAQGFNIQSGTLYGMVNEWLEREIDVEWKVMRLLESENTDPYDSRQTEYGWRQITNVSELAGARAIVVNPELAGYLKDEGFVADRGDTGFESYFVEDHHADRVRERFTYELESYEDHIRHVLSAFQDNSLPELAYPARALEAAAGWPEGSVVEAAWLTCLFHDLGKLTQGWQAWARAYQSGIGRPLPRGYAAAHTDYDPGNPFNREVEQAVRRTHPRPTHAAEGALAAARVIANALGPKELAKAAITALTRHHTPFASDCKTFALERSVVHHIEETLAYIPDHIGQRVDLQLLKTNCELPPTTFSNMLIGPAGLNGWLAYALLARALRRADQVGTAKRIHSQKN